MECIMTQRKKKGGGVRWEIIEKGRRNIILIKNICIINKLMWMFCKSDGAK